MNKEKTLEEFTTAFKVDNPKATDEEIKAAYDESLLEGMNLTEKVVAVMDDYGKMLMAQMKATLQKQMDEVVKSTQDELVAAIRKGVGLDEDPVVHLSEVTAVVRKMLLDADSGKQTADDPGTGPGGEPAPDGDTRKFDLEKRFTELSKGMVI